MREIKFKGWWTGGNEFVFLNNKSDKSMAFQIGGYITDLDLEENTNNIWVLQESIVDEIIWCQYTGQKDKNGVEIYEGDIIELYLDGKYISNYICEFKDGCFMFKEIGSDWIGRITNTDIEVIGNIYENQDLIKG